MSIVGNHKPGVKLKYGFTLVELLVVIAIIGILSSLILTALGSGRDQARHAELTESFITLRTQVAEYFLENGTYGPVIVAGESCSGGVFSDSKILFLRTNIYNRTSSTTETCAVGPDSESFAFSMQSGSHGTVCVDNGRIYSNSIASGGGASTTAVCTAL